MGIIIRTAFNNQNWNGTCHNADRDRRLFQCQKSVVDTGYKINKKGICQASCWERNLCVNYNWYSNDNFGVRATGKAFFLFRDVDETLVLWGKSEIKNTDENKIIFKPFKPLTKNARLTNLTYQDLELLGVPKWGSRTFRYLDKETESRIESLLKNQNQLLDDPSEEYLDVEGKKRFRKHLVKERSAKLIKIFKNSLDDFSCSICGFSFEKIYGDIGKEFIEAHHIIPVAELKPETKVSISDLIAVCSNCHRMLHCKQPLLSKKKLQKIILQNKTKAQQINGADHKSQADFRLIQRLRAAFVAAHFSVRR